MDPSIIASGLGAAGGLVSSVVGGLFGARNQDKANQTNIRLQRETNELNRYLAEHQFSLAATDMERAGLSKNLAAGHPMSLPALGAAQVQSQGDYGLSDASDKVSRGVQAAAELMRAQADISKTNAEIEYINSQREGVDLSNIERNFTNSVLAPRWTMEQGTYDYLRKKALQDIEESVGRVGLMPHQSDLMDSQAFGALATGIMQSIEAKYADDMGWKMPTPSGQVSNPVIIGGTMLGNLFGRLLQGDPEKKAAKEAKKAAEAQAKAKAEQAKQAAKAVKEAKKEADAKAKAQAQAKAKADQLSPKAKADAKQIVDNLLKSAYNFKK